MRALLDELRRGQVRARRWLVAGALLVVAGLTAYAWVTRSRACVGGEDTLAGVWDEELRAQIHKAFTARLEQLVLFAEILDSRFRTSHIFTEITNSLIKPGIGALRSFKLIL